MKKHTVYVFITYSRIETPGKGEILKKSIRLLMVAQKALAVQVLRKAHIPINKKIEPILVDKTVVRNKRAL